ncbi:MAG TPA: flagellar biosynthesis protein FlhB [Solirubrobacteraceae bacterium]|jgi:flagellar biosynthetic protein FlhB|nr:flagellar biosynthesis protein FlhB [Solirubrobacteraceae bacterium]
MAQHDRTEKATPKRREHAREKGQVARSADAGGSLVLIAGLFALSLLGPAIVGAGAESFRRILAMIARPAQATSTAGLQELLHETLQTMLVTVGPIAGICMATGLLAGVAQVGFHPSAKALAPDFRRINPISGLRNLLGPNTIFEALKAVTKVSAVAGVAALALLPGMGDLASQVGIPPAALGKVLGAKAMSIAQHAAFAYLAIGVIDLAWQRRRHAKQLRMTKQEVKDELRQYGVSAEVRAALRRRQMQAARARMMAAVPEADVVLTNPTHFAVALRYDGAQLAPEVVAKGQDLIAAQIRRVAEEHDVPIVPDPPLARALHSSTEIGQVIPQELYAAVAQVLAFVYRLAARRRRAV